jgi:flavin reductase (DIM6/NTAB) family NADH-FMN oxidoreductase RutF
MEGRLLYLLLQSSLKETAECVLNFVPEGIVENVNATGSSSPQGVWKWSFSGLTSIRNRSQDGCLCTSQTMCF